MSSAQARESIIRLIMNHVVDGEPATPEELANAILSALELGEAEPVAWQYRWKLDGEWTNWRASDASQRHSNLKDLEERPLYTNPVPTPDGAVEARLSTEDENYLQEIADGAWGDDPRARGLARDRLSAALSHPADGWRLVPVEPTTGMLRAAGECASRMREVNGGPCGADYYRAMLAASPLAVPATQEAGE